LGNAPTAPSTVAPSSAKLVEGARSETALPKRQDSFERARVEQLAEKLRAARVQTKESAPVSVDALAKKLEQTAEQLREKHRGKQVDFEVIIRDGKAILKPFVR
jgi:hypothetical protein